MEYVVRFVKGYLWFVFFNKSEKIFLKWIVVFVGMKYIFEEFEKKLMLLFEFISIELNYLKVMKLK